MRSMMLPHPMKMCEGSYEPVIDASAPDGRCPVCGRIVPLASDGVAGIHNRDDLAEMVRRGDFG